MELKKRTTRYPQVSLICNDGVGHNGHKQDTILIDHAIGIKVCNHIVCKLQSKVNTKVTNNF